MQNIKLERDILVLAKEETHEWIIALEEAFQDTQYLYLAMEYAPGGDFAAHMMQVETFSLDAARFYLAEMINAVFNICHFSHS